MFLFPRIRILSVIQRRSSPLLPLTRPLHFYRPRRNISPPPQQKQSANTTGLSQRLKHLIKSYGWYALGIYIILSAVDFSIAFGAINVLGADKVSLYTHRIKEWATQLVFNQQSSTAPVSEPGREEMDLVSRPSDGREGLYAMIVLAYTVHKTLFLPVRVALTAAITPRLVNWLRARGWAGGAGTMRAAREMRERVRSRAGSSSDNDH